ncbi:Tetraacyldisaccharide 4'-kinase [Marinomonas aquimarina]|uniref:Tetraacyldisaccharide 4'-kinase n=1 Tax=Marinomonas aquimarina TaxID=295068 RepID=A0A1A8THK1_9GAMM|nr:tetraacyldisaccharide 4'-kinase [Marinomonas aquimarina]SBS31828.1 Tetraacyldisaccharide 4'-kinase [Marinomonas aquimarina]
MSLERSISRSWYAKVGWTWCLAPLLMVTAPIVKRKRRQFLAQRKQLSYQSRLPVVVVGNITVGGTGKSPMVIALANLLKQQGYRPGIVTRGHKRDSNQAILVAEHSAASEVGDEPLMLQRRTGCPVAVSAKRADAVQTLETLPDVDIIISDDGLQHYAMDRDLEVVMVDAERGLGNHMLLPVGPLREPAQRLDEADFVFAIGKPAPVMTRTPSYHGALHLANILHIASAKQSLPLAALAQRAWLVVAGIGNPKRFVSTLQDQGLPATADTRFFADHHAYQRSDLDSSCSILMTEKDAVKVESFAKPTDDWWYVAAELELPEEFVRAFMARLKDVIQQKTQKHE